MISVSFFGRLYNVTKKDIRSDLTVYIGYLKFNNNSEVETIRVEAFKPLPKEDSLVFGTGLLKTKPMLHIKVSSVQALEEGEPIQQEEVVNAKKASKKVKKGEQLELDLNCPF